MVEEELSKIWQQVAKIKELTAVLCQRIDSQTNEIHISIYDIISIIVATAKTLTNNITTIIITTITKAMPIISNKDMDFIV
jgi:hypothetical protein